MASEVLGIALAELLEGAPADACAAALELLTKLCDNAAADHAKFGTVKRSSKALQSRLLGLSSGAAALLALGFTLDEAADAYVAPAEDVLTDLEHACFPDGTALPMGERMGMAEHIIVGGTRRRRAHWRRG